MTKIRLPLRNQYNLQEIIIFNENIACHRCLSGNLDSGDRLAQEDLKNSVGGGGHIPVAAGWS